MNTIFNTYCFILIKEENQNSNGNKCFELYNHEFETKLKTKKTLDYNRQMPAANKELSIKSNTTAKPLKMKDLMQHYKSKFSKNNQTKIQ